MLAAAQNAIQTSAQKKKRDQLMFSPGRKKTGVDAAATARAKRKIPAPVRDWPNLLPRESPGANALLRTPPAATPRADRDTFAARTVGGTIAVAGAQRKPRAPPSGTATGTPIDRRRHANDENVTPAGHPGSTRPAGATRTPLGGASTIQRAAAPPAILRDPRGGAAAKPVARHPSETVARRMSFDGADDGNSLLPPAKKLRVTVAALEGLEDASDGDDASRQPPSTHRSATTTTDAPAKCWLPRPKPGTGPPDPFRDADDVADAPPPPERPANPFANPFAAAKAKAASAVARVDAERAAAIAARPVPRTPGLRNLGNTCYLNATLQVLCGLEEFARAAEAKPLADGGFDDGSVYSAVRGLVAARRASHERAKMRAAAAAAAESTPATSSLPSPRGPSAVLSPAEVKTAVQRRHTHYAGNRQHDAHEFLCECLDALEEEVTAAYTDGRLAAPEPKSVVPLHRTLCPTRRNFTTAVAATLTCESCGDACVRHETFRHLSVELPESSGDDESADVELASLLDGFFAPEVLERKCERDGCDGTSATLVRRIVRLPRVLVVHLKRFRYVQTGGTKAAARVGGDDENARDGNAPTRAEPAPAPAPFAMRMVKATRPVKLPTELTLEPFVAEDASALRGPPPRSNHPVAADAARPIDAATADSAAVVPAGKARSKTLAGLDENDDKTTTPAVPRRLNLCLDPHEDDSKGARGSSNPTPGAIDGGFTPADGGVEHPAETTPEPRGARDEATAAVHVYPDDASPSGADAKRQAGAYELRGVVSHVGSSLEFGHYVAHVRGPRRDGGVGWTTFDDEAVDEVEEGRVLRDRTGCYVAVYALGD